MRGQCRCGNIRIVWQIVDLSLVPRACQCSYCEPRGAAWVSKSGSAFEATIAKPRLHRTVSHGSGYARFHECDYCGQLVFATAEIDGELYGILNARLLDNRLGFATAVTTDFSDEDAEQKMSRWRRNWCHPVTVHGT